MSEINSTNIDAQNNEIYENVYLTDNENKYLLDKDENYLTVNYIKENDIMANTKKYVSLEKLGLYDEKIKKVVSDGDAAALASAKAYADGLAVNYDAAGAAATAEANAKAHADTEVAKANAAAATAQAAAEAASAAAGVADGKAVKAQGDVDALTGVVAELDAYVGDIPTGYTETNVIAYINKKAQETLDAASGGSSESAASVLAALNTYKSENDPKVTKNTEDIAGLTTDLAEEVARADAAEKANAAAIKAVADDYLKGADRTALEQAITNAVAAEAERATGVEGGLEDRIETMEAFWTAAQADGTDSNVIDTLKEIQEYIAGDETGAAEMLASIQKNAQDISNMDTAYKAADTTLQGNIDTLTGVVATKAAQSALDEVSGKVSALETESAKHALKTEVQAVSDALGEYKTAHAGDYTNAQIDDKIKVNADAIAALNDIYATDDELASAISAEVTRANGAYAVKGLETTVANHMADTVAHVTADDKVKWNAALQASDITTGTANGSIAVKGTDVAVKGLGSAAFTDATAYDAAGAASAVDTKLTTEVNRATAKENELAAAIAAFVEASEQEILDLFK